MTTASKVHIIGGGLGGLTAAVYLVRAGRQVCVYERAEQLGGRARTTEVEGYALNVGPHALYAGGEGAAVLRELGIACEGGLAASSGAYAIRRGHAHTLPIGFVSLLTSGLLSIGEKLSLARVLGGLAKMDPGEQRGLTLREWVESVADTPVLRELLHATARLSTYAHAPDLADAGAVLRQLQRAASRGVIYLHGGWQTLVDALAEAAVAAGARIETGARIDSLDQLDRGEVVIAAPPRTAERLLGRRWDLLPVRAACLDLALSSLPRPRALFALGIDEPTYFSVHTGYANLAPDGGAVIHVAKYLRPDESTDPASDRAELEALVDRMQPGWRERIVHQRYLPRMTVSHALVTPGGRPAGVCDGVHLVGDWIDSEGMLADATFASARAAARRIAGGAASEEREAA